MEEFQNLNYNFIKILQACLCQVPKLVRKSLLPPEGCSFCGCSGKIIDYYILLKNKKDAIQRIAINH